MFSADNSESATLSRHEAGSARSLPEYKSVRRTLRLLEIVSKRGEGLTAKRLARDLGVSCAVCYYLINTLVDEGYLERLPRRQGYRLGPAVPALFKLGPSTNVYARVEPVLEELAERCQREAYFGVLSEGAVAVTEVKSAPKRSSVGLVRGSRVASHALSMGKVLLAETGSEGVQTYVESYGLEAFTARTVTQPAMFEAELRKVRTQGFASNLEEFSENLCCVAAPIRGEGGAAEGAVALATTTQLARNELRHLVDMAVWAAGEASG